MSEKNSPKKIVPKNQSVALAGMSDLRQLRDSLRQTPQAKSKEIQKSPVPKNTEAKLARPASEKLSERRSSVAPAGPGLPLAPTLPFRNPPPVITYPEELPVSGRRAEIAEALAKHQVIIVCGETGSGKTTQLPKICLELGRGQKGLIGHTQPRRIAASSTAKRIAQELNSPLGEHVGFKVRFTDTLTKGASVKLMTDGILLAETQTDPLLKQYDTIIIDEAHERSLNIDFLLGYLKQILPKRRDLKLIITSATIDAQRFANHFADASDKPAPVIEVSGRLYPVEIRYRPVDIFPSPAGGRGARGEGDRKGDGLNNLPHPNPLPLAGEGARGERVA